MYLKLKLAFAAIYIYIHTGFYEHTEKEIYSATRILSVQDDIGIQWINYRDRELNPHSCEIPASRLTVLTTVPNRCEVSMIFILGYWDIREVNYFSQLNVCMIFNYGSHEIVT